MIYLISELFEPVKSHYIIWAPINSAYSLKTAQDRIQESINSIDPNGTLLGGASNGKFYIIISTSSTSLPKDTTIEKIHHTDSVFINARPVDADFLQRLYKSYTRFDT